LRRRGGVAVFLGRFTAFFRAMMPALAGASRMPYLRFLAWNAAGGAVWGTLFVVVGYAAGASYHQVERQVGRGIAIALVLVIVAAGVTWRLRSERTPKTP
jgi:membrane-associated protein